jgi:urease accessory protein
VVLVVVYEGSGVDVVSTPTSSSRPLAVMEELRNRNYSDAIKNHVQSNFYLITTMNNAADTETYLLLLLADGNLPTGSFVASSGLESYVTHGFHNNARSFDETIEFVRDSVGTYARSALPFVSDTHQIVEAYAANSDAYIEGNALDRSLADLRALDDLYEAMTLNHVAKRASRSQGVALLTLYSRGFSKPPSFPSQHQNHREIALNKLIDQHKLVIRKEETPGHLPICWGLLTGALGLSLGECTSNTPNTYMHLTCNRALSVSASISSCSESIIRFSPPEHDRPLCVSASATACNSPHC